ncbi:hypothetical protein BC936DRAFT_139016 [Jimgerdemannia flammicorona]|uniref:Uncharacterized protein n=1 Tax=Jimgerdemannia flammicorona TaxID=994334 RepID=A0A433BAT4_9FUNG|nr:hypothetical protein BC936DRAFT_139016 [Jimgerdemannia flammicorona]
MTDTNPKEGRNTSCPPGFKIIQDRKFRSRGNTSHVLPCDEDEINRLDYQHYMARLCVSRLSVVRLIFLLRSIFQLPSAGQLQLPRRGAPGEGHHRFGRRLRQRTVEHRNGQGIPEVDLHRDGAARRCSEVCGPAAEPDIHHRGHRRGPTVRGRGVRFCLPAVSLPKLYEERLGGGDTRACEGDEAGGLAGAHRGDRFYDALRTTTLSRGIDIEYPTRLGSLLTDNGFTGVAADYISCPIGWRGRPGVLLQRNMSFLMDALKPSIMPVLGIGEDDYADLAGQFHEDYGACRCYTNAPYAYGRKPLNEGR